jgi:MFS family permease
MLFSASFNMLIPELPDYLSSLGGAEHKGLIIALFTLTAGISRPISGKLTDTIGRIPVMIVGSAVCVLCGFLYPILSSISGFLFLRLVHGFSTGFKPTATSAYIADIVPQARWGEALGMHGLAFSLGMAIGPALGSYITQLYSMNVLFYASSAFALFSILIVINLKETLTNRQTYSWSLMSLSRSDLFDIRVLPAALVTVLYYLTYGVILTLIPDWSGHIGMENKGIFFMAYTVASLAIRFLAGRLSDTHGRLKVSKCGLALLIFAMIVLGYGKDPLWLISGACLYGMATGIVSPALNAWTIDLSHPNFRGKALSTMYIALEAGIGLGALYSGWLYKDLINRIPLILQGTSLAACSALIYIFWWESRERRRARQNLHVK